VGADAGGGGKARQRMEREQAVAEQIDTLTAAAVRDASSTPVVLAVRSGRPVRHGSSLTSGTCCSVRLRRPLCGSTLALAQASPYQWRCCWHTWTSKWSWQGGLSPPLSVILPVRRATVGVRTHKLMHPRGVVVRAIRGDDTLVPESRLTEVLPAQWRVLMQ
jgi:hypothetical protein